MFTSQLAISGTLRKLPDVFKDKLGFLQGAKVQLLVDDTKPKVHMCRLVPFVFKEKVDAEVNRLQSLGIISPVQFSRWVALVPVVKHDDSVRIFGDLQSYIKTGVSTALRLSKFTATHIYMWVGQILQLNHSVCIRLV